MSASTAVTERRLRQIYNALDANNNKKALQEADKLLKKQPNFHCAKALRALALYRLDRVQECQHIVDSVVAELPTDDNSLQALTICYKELHQAHKICELYEAVLNKEPANEEFLSHLFMAYVRVMDYKRQHQTAMSLYKAFPKNPYYFWAVMSLFMQAVSTSGQSSMTAGVALQLADRMCQKFQKEERLESDAEVQLYLMVLEQKGNYNAALELLSGKLANLLRTPNFIKHKRIVYLKELKRWRELTEFCKQLIRESPSRWQNYSVFMSACFAAVGDEVGAAVHLRDGDSLLQVYGSCSQRSPTGCLRVPSEGQSEGCGTSPDITQAIVDRVENPKSAAASGVSDESLPIAANDVSNEPPPIAVSDVSKESPPVAVSDVSKKSPTVAVSDVSKESTTVAVSDVSKESPTVAVSDVSKESPPSSYINVSKGHIVDVAYREADTFLRRLRDDVDRREKAPLLASLRLCILVNEHNQLHLLNHDIVEDLVEYVRCYGNKSCCFDDVRSVLPLVSSSRREELLQRCQAMVSLTSDSAPASLSDLVRHQTWLQLRQHYGTGLPGSERLTRVEQLCQWHAQTVRFGDGLLDTDFRPNDLYLVLAVYHLYDEWTCTGDSFHLIHALTLLDHASFVSPANFNFKLLAIHLYCILGATGAGLTICETLDLKSIQLDTLSHICCRSVAAQGYLASAQLLFNVVCKFFVSSSKDNSDSLIAAYKVGSFQQIPEFIGLRTRLYNSLNYRLTATDCCLLDLTVHTSHHSQTAEAVGYTDLLSACIDDGIMWNHLRDNRDMSVLPVFSDADAERRELARVISFQQDVLLLKIRHRLLRVVLTAVSFPPSVDPAATFRQLSSELRQLSVGQQFQEAPLMISGGFHSRRLQLQLSVLPLLLLLIESTAAALDGAAAAGDDAAQQLCAQLRLEHGCLEGGAAEQLESAAILAETLSVAAVLCGAAHAALRPADVRSRRKSRSADAHNHNVVVRVLLELCDWLLQLLPAVDARLKLQLLSWRVRRMELPVCGLQQAVADGGARCQVLLGSSYQDAVAELSKLLTHKRSYLSSCLL